MKTRFLSVTALLLTAGLASVAQAAPPSDGDLVFTDEYSDAVYHLPIGGAPSLLFSTPASSRLAGITRNGSDWFFADGPGSGAPGSRILKATGLFSGAPVVTTLATGTDVENPIGIKYHGASGNIIGVMNPVDPTKFEGLLGVNAGSSAQTRLFQEPNPATTPSPRYNAGAYIVQDANRGGNRFLVTNANGGVDAPDPSEDNLVASTLHGFTIGSDLTTTHDFIYDFSSSSTGLANTLFEVRGIAINGDNVYVSDILRGEIYKLTLSGAGTVSGISLLASGLDQPESLIYNPFTNKLIIDEIGELDPSRSRISQINVDGTGYEILARGYHARGFEIVPTPGTLALLGFGGLMAGRRRRV